MQAQVLIELSVKNSLNTIVSGVGSPLHLTHAS